MQPSPTAADAKQEQEPTSTPHTRTSTTCCDEEVSYTCCSDWLLYTCNCLEVLVCTWVHSKYYRMYHWWRSGVSNYIHPTYSLLTVEKFCSSCFQTCSLRDLCDLFVAVGLCLSCLCLLCEAIAECDDWLRLLVLTANNLKRDLYMCTCIIMQPYRVEPHPHNSTR